ncbi:MAG: TIGR03067 domain-containing protein [Planctomycetes bacterium]|nr:TIGR03067 domain-containing protein [Planctomycetota bacterium]
MKLLLSFVFALGLFGIAAAEDKKDPSVGKWVVESVIRDGKAIDAYKGGTRVNGGGKYTFTPPAESKIPATTGTYTIDASKTPITFDAVAKGGTFDGKTLLGIFKVEGDTMTVAFAEPGKERPTKFESAAGSGVVLTVYKKAK